MKILVAADGSKYTKKALAFLVTQEGLAGPDGEILVLNVQLDFPPHVRRMLGAPAIRAYQRDESRKVLEPVERFLKRHKLTFRTRMVVGHYADEIVKAAIADKAQMIVMGTHGYGALGRAIMGSVATRVVANAEVPVLLVK